LSEVILNIFMSVPRAAIANISDKYQVYYYFIYKIPDIENIKQLK